MKQSVFAVIAGVGSLLAVVPSYSFAQSGQCVKMLSLQGQLDGHLKMKIRNECNVCKVAVYQVQDSNTGALYLPQGFTLPANSTSNDLYLQAPLSNHLYLREEKDCK